MGEARRTRLALIKGGKADLARAHRPKPVRQRQYTIVLAAEPPHDQAAEVERMHQEMREGLAEVPKGLAEFLSTAAYQGAKIWYQAWKNQQHRLVELATPNIVLPGAGK